MTSRNVEEDEEKERNTSPLPRRASTGNDLTSKK
jgi:hypothetical protein